MLEYLKNVELYHIKQRKQLHLYSLNKSFTDEMFLQLSFDNYRNRYLGHRSNSK